MGIGPITKQKTIKKILKLFNNIKILIHIQNNKNNEIKKKDKNLIYKLN